MFCIGSFIIDKMDPSLSKASTTSLSKASARKDAVAKTVIIEKLHDELSRNIEDNLLSAHQLFQLVESKLANQLKSAAANALHTCFKCLFYYYEPF